MNKSNAITLLVILIPLVIFGGFSIFLYATAPNYPTSIQDWQNSTVISVRSYPSQAGFRTTYLQDVSVKILNGTTFNLNGVCQFFQVGDNVILEIAHIKSQPQPLIAILSVATPSGQDNAPQSC